MACSQGRETLGEKKRNSLLCALISHLAETDTISLRSPLGKCQIAVMEEAAMRTKAFGVDLPGWGKN